MLNQLTSDITDALSQLPADRKNRVAASLDSVDRWH